MKRRETGGSSISGKLQKSSSIENPAGHVPLDKETRADLRAELVASSRGTKQSIANVLKTLQSKGLLNDDSLGATENERDHLRRAVERHAYAETPCGKVVQTILIEVDGKRVPWEIIHPMAYIYHLSRLCSDFADIMHTAIANARNQCLRMILYGDELTPGNPLRVDNGRQAFCFYYAFLEWPAWMLHRKDGWLCFGALRTTIIHKLTGGVAGLMRKILELFFVDGATNFTKGFMYEHGGEVEYCRAQFAGFIADEKGLK